MKKKISTYQDDLIEALKDSREAAAYLSAAIEDGNREVFLLALRNVAEAQGGMAALAKKTDMNRESLYRMLSSRGNPEIKSILSLLGSMKFKVKIEPEQKTASRTKRKTAASAHAA